MNITLYNAYDNTGMYYKKVEIIMKNKFRDYYAIHYDLIKLVAGLDDDFYICGCCVNNYNNHRCNICCPHNYFIKFRPIKIRKVILRKIKKGRN